MPRWRVIRGVDAWQDLSNRKKTVLERSARAIRRAGFRRSHPDVPAVRVLVVGAGPGGSAAAIELARGGADVRLVEKARWPRAKTCGDGISPPGVWEAALLGVSLDDRRPLPQGEISTPSGTVFRSGWRSETPWGAIVPRAEFDARLVASALRAGARFDDATVVRELALATGGPRATFATNGSPERFDAVVLAEGATGTLARGLGFGKHSSRLVALRGYADASRRLDDVFGLYFDRGISPGYGWIFPLDERRANVGLLVDERAVRRRGGDLRGMFASWLRTSPRARAVLDPWKPLESLSGGIIPTGRRRRTAAGIFLVGDAAGVADPFSAEGIYQAMSSGRAAARVLLQHGPGRAAERAYGRALRPFDRNAREATRLRLGFAFVIDPLAKRALRRPALAHHLSSTGFFMKESLPEFLWGIARTW
jgi:geranylgeranyl reductase family protein